MNENKQMLPFGTKGNMPLVYFLRRKGIEPLRIEYIYGDAIRYYEDTEEVRAAIGEYNQIFESGGWTAIEDYLFPKTIDISCENSATIQCRCDLGVENEKTGR